MKFLLPVDGSPASLAAVRHALRLSRQGLKASFVLVNVQEPPSLYEVIVAHDADVIEKVRGAAGADLLHAAQALLASAGAQHDSVLASGDPAHQLVEVLEDHACDAVVMGARGMGQPAAADLGSVALALLRHCPAPVTVVHARRAEDTAGADSAE